MNDAWWWTYLVIIIAGWLATDLWRWLGVIVGNRLDDESEALQWVRAVATALVMAVTSKLVFFPTGTLADSPLWLRLAALGIGFLAFLVTGQRVIVCVGVSISLLIAGLMVL